MTTQNNDARSASAEHPLAFASISVYGDSLDPVFWTTYFACTPDRTLIKGVPFTTSSGRPSKFPARTGAWRISSREAVVSNGLTRHIEYLVSKLLLPRADLPKLLELRGETMRCFCYWDNYAGDRVPVIDPRIEAAIKESGGYIEIDEYK